MNEIGEHREPDYEKAELDLIRDALKKTHEERFKTMMKLMRRGIMLKNAKIVHQPLSATNKETIMKSEEIVSKVAEPASQYGFIHQSEDEKLLVDATRPYVEKLQLFSKMLKRNKMLKKVVVSSK